MLVYLEGIDGVGKTTQAERVAQHYRDNGFKVLVSREPGGTEVGNLIRSIVKRDDIDPETTSLLMAADRIEHAKHIKPYLDKGYLVISDRGILSSYAYQGAMGLPVERIDAINAGLASKLGPLWSYYNCPILLTRDNTTIEGGDQFEDRGSAFLQDVQARYEALIDPLARVYVVEGGLDATTQDIVGKINFFADMFIQRGSEELNNTPSIQAFERFLYNH